MSLIDFTREELKELDKVLNVDKSDTAAYEYEGAVHSMYQRNEHGYRVNVKNDDKVWLFIFQDKKPKYVIGQLLPSLDDLLPTKKESIFKKMINSLSRRKR